MLEHVLHVCRDHTMACHDQQSLADTDRPLTEQVTEASVAAAAEPGTSNYATVQEAVAATSQGSTDDATAAAAEQDSKIAELSAQVKSQRSVGHRGCCNLYTSGELQRDDVITSEGRNAPQPQQAHSRYFSQTLT